jgi:hypothetical protein
MALLNVSRSDIAWWFTSLGRAQVPEPTETEINQAKETRRVLMQLPQGTEFEPAAAASLAQSRYLNGQMKQVVGPQPRI